MNYIRSAPGLRDTGEDPLSHYLRIGWQEGRDPHPSFVTRYYLALYPDVAEASVNPLVHFVVADILEGRSPNALFSPDAFTRAVPNPRRLSEADVDALGAACLQLRQSLGS